MTIIRGSEGCFGMNIYIDEEPVEELELDKLKLILQEIISSIETKESACDMLYHTISNLGTYTPDEDQCETCGTWGGEYVIETTKN